ncbi:hypothetical protein [Lederbergia lenta]|uniref:hypothetical protein n=1 Tax=Lederbergia lenta TaxID=1467 RepID=UPI00203DB121|nr:hypothetical protein [Lederbergia lenta]MCM3112833.1 hypothetical protein [Lederbergia lenta]
MDVIKIFWKYMHKYHPHLVKEDWMIETIVVKRKSSVFANEEVRKLIPMRMYSYLKLFVFFCEDTLHPVISLIHNKEGRENLAVGCLINNELVHLIKPNKEDW